MIPRTKETTTNKYGNIDLILSVCYRAFMKLITHHNWPAMTYFALTILLAGSELIASMALKGAGMLLPIMLIIAFIIGRLGLRPARIFLLFAIPATGAIPYLIGSKHPFNYIPTLLIIIAGLSLARPETFTALSQNYLFKRYRLFFLFTLLGALFLVLRWSSLSEQSMRLFPNLLCSPAGDRLSYTILFPILTLCLFGLTPLMLGLRKSLNMTPDNVFIPLVSGFFLSALFAMLQQVFKLPLFSRPGWIDIAHSNGMASDFNGLGLISGFIFFYALTVLKKSPKISTTHRVMAAVALPLSLLCAWWSHSRTALLIFLVALVWVTYSRRSRLFNKSVRWIWLSIPLLLLLLSFTLPQIRHHLLRTLRPQEGQTVFSRIDQLSNGRLSMLSDSVETVISYPISGIGPGNYLFYQRYKHFNSSFLHDLPLNQFLLILLEGGFFSLGVFVFWLWGWFRQSPPPWAWLMVAFCLSFLVGTPLWLPEGMALFWLIIALGSAQGPTIPKPQLRNWLFVIGMLLLFIFSNLLNFKDLDPSQWQKDLTQPNNYGFWDADPGMEQMFRWTKQRSGMYVNSNEANLPGIYCGAPLPHMPQKKQTVHIFWRGKPLQKLIFTENTNQVISLPPGMDGWLEFLVEPVFNLKEMGLGPETRTLGVQIHFQQP